MQSPALFKRLSSNAVDIQIIRNVPRADHFCRGLAMWKRKMTSPKIKLLIIGLIAVTMLATSLTAGVGG